MCAMTRRLATICLMTMLLVGFRSPSASAQGDKYSVATLKGISAVYVVVESLDDAKVLGLEADTIRTDVELKLRLAGMRVVKEKEGIKFTGSPHVYVRTTWTPESTPRLFEMTM